MDIIHAINQGLLSAVQNSDRANEETLKATFGISAGESGKVKSMNAQDMLLFSHYPLMIVRVKEDTLISEIERLERSNCIELGVQTEESFISAGRYKELFLHCLKQSILTNKMAASVMFCLDSETLERFDKLNPLQIMQLALSDKLEFQRTKAFPSLRKNMSENSVQKTRRLVQSITEIRKMMVSTLPERAAA